MARHDKGWVKLERQPVLEDIGSNPYCLALWSWLLCAAVWKETIVIWEGNPRVLRPGTVIFGFRELAEKWGCSKSTVSKWAHYLHKSGRIELEVCPRGACASIRNREDSESSEDLMRPQTGHSVATESPQTDRNVALIEEVKNEKNKEIEDLSKFDLSLENVELAHATWLSSLKKMGVRRSNLLEFEQDAIGTAIQQHGIKAVVCALQGVPVAVVPDGFDRSWSLDVTRVLNSKNFGRYLNVGIQAGLKAWDDSQATTPKIKSEESA